MSSFTIPTENSQNGAEASPLDIDPVWMSSRTARQIYALGEVEKDIARLLSLAASSISLLTLPQTDAPDDALPQGGERSEQFVLEVSEYFERLDSVHVAIRSSLAHIRQSRIAPSTITAPPPGAIPPSLGVGLPFAQRSGRQGMRGLQEERVERDAWRGLLDSVARVKEGRSAGVVGCGGGDAAKASMGTSVGGVLLMGTFQE